MSLVPGTPDYLNDNLLQETFTQRLAEARATLHGLIIKQAGMSSTSADGVSVAYNIKFLQDYITTIQPQADAENTDNWSIKIIPRLR